MERVNNKSEIRYKLEEKPPLKALILLSFQTIFIGFGGIIAAPLVISGSLKLPFEEVTFWVSCALFVSGIVTMIQAHGLGKHIGSRLPIIMGTSFGFVGTSISVAKSYGIGAMFCCGTIAAIIVIIFSKFTKSLLKYFPPVVTGTVVTLIGLTVIPVGIEWLGGGAGSANYGSVSNIVVGLIVMAIIIILNQFGNEVVSSSSIVIGILCGYALTYFTNMLDLSQIKTISWFSFPKPFKYGIGFSLPAVLAFIPVYFATIVETIGDNLAISSSCEHDLTPDELQKGVLCDGIGSFISGIFNSSPITSFSQCAGLVSVTGVASRYVGILAGFLLLVCGLLPKFAALIASMPEPVLGGAGVIMFGMIAGSGIKMLGNIKFDRRNMLVVSVSLTLGLGVIFKPDILNNFPKAIQTIFGSGVTTGTISAIVLNIILPKQKNNNLNGKNKKIAV